MVAACQSFSPPEWQVKRAVAIPSGRQRGPLARVHLGVWEIRPPLGSRSTARSDRMAGAVSVKPRPAPAMTFSASGPMPANGGNLT